jgi:DNA-directed DNA polymerase III PolC
MNLCHLHSHSTFSLQDGWGLPDQIANRIKELGHGGCAITDHGNLFSVLPFNREFKKRGLKFIPGVEAYVVEDHTLRTNEQSLLGIDARPHVTLIAADQVGYRNLLALNRAAWRDGFYYKPRITWDLIAQHQEGLVVLSGCIAGWPSLLTINRGPEAAFEWVRYWSQRIEHFTVELDPAPCMGDSSSLATEILVKIAWELKLPCVVTADAHFPRPDDHAAQDLMQCVGIGKRLSDKRDFRTPGYQYLCTAEELLQRCVDVAPSVPRWFFERAINHSMVIADKCEFELPRAKSVAFPGLREDQTPDLELAKWVNDGLVKRCSDGHLTMVSQDHGDWINMLSRYKQRVDHELSIIKEKGFANYILAVADVCRHMKARNTLVMVRGSAGGCLALYLVGASETDSLRHGLSFERFYDSTRDDPPDIDVDFERLHRDEAIHYVYEKYGRENCSQIAALTKLKAKAAVQDVCFALGIHRGEYSPLSDALDSTDEDVDTQLHQVTDPRALVALERYPAISKLVPQLVGQYRNQSIHAAGVLVSSEPLDQVIGVVLGSDKQTVAAVDKRGASDVGLLKMDFLSVNSLDVVARAIRRLGHSVDHLYSLPLDDEQALSLANAGVLAGVFQLSGGAAGRVCREIGVHSFDDVVAASGLCRPGPAEWVQTYKRYKDDAEELAEYLSYFSPEAASIIAPTYGVLLYQEQVMALAREFAGLSWADVHKLRKGVQNKLGLDPQTGDAWRAEWSEKFIAGALANGKRRSEAKFWWRSLESHGAYSFNMCVAGDTVVIRAGAGKYDTDPKITVRELFARQESETCVGWKIRQGRLSILQMDDDQRVRPAKLKAIYCNGVKPTLRLHLKSGKSIRVTHNHKLLTIGGYVRADKMQVSDQLVTMGDEEQRIKTGNWTWAKGQSYEGMGFQAGELNPGYVDGRSINLKQAHTEVLQRAKGKCEQCLRSYDNSRFEFAHVKSLLNCDGQYDVYHGADNIEWLCNSCHKKFDYAKGERKKRWSRGLPTVLDDVVAITDGGEIDTYDIEMDSEQHNFIADGVVSHNSHATTYGLIGYWMLYLKAHHPDVFYESYLQLDDDKVTMKRLIAEYRARGGEIQLLDPAHSRETFTSPREGLLIGGYCNIKGIGPITAAKIAERAPYADWDDLLERGLPRAVAAKLSVARQDTQSLVALAPWLPIERIGHRESALRSEYGVATLAHLKPYAQESDALVAGYVMITDFGRDHVQFILEDEHQAVLVRVARKSVTGSLGQRVRRLECSDYVAIKGWWSGDALFIRDFALLQKLSKKEQRC